MNPVFQDRPQLAQRVRLSGTPEDSDTDRALSGAIGIARATLYQRLGSSRVGQLQGIPLTDPEPDSKEELDKVLAIELEWKLVKRELLKTNSTFFAEGFNLVAGRFNEEGFIRESDPQAREKELAQLTEDIEAIFGNLGEGTNLEDTDRVALIEPATYQDPTPFNKYFTLP